jgi:PAS domain S-box-containing protein
MNGDGDHKVHFVPIRPATGTESHSSMPGRPSLQPPPHWMSILDMFHNGIMILDREGIIAVYNKAARRIFGEKRATHLGRHINEFRPTVWPDFQKIIATGQSQIGIKLSIDRATIIANRSPIILDGQVLGVISVFQDISEYERISDQLQSFQRLTRELEAIIESSYDGLYITDGKANTIRVNRSYERITGLNRKDLIGRNMHDLVRDQVFDHSVSLEVLKKRGPVTLMQVVKGDKQVIVTGTPIYDDAGEIVLVVTNVRDITELNDLKAELENSRRITSRMVQTLMERDDIDHALRHMVIKSQGMMQVVRMAIKVADAGVPVLLQGESGAGKSMLARIIHQISQRKQAPFLKINCSTIPPSLMESELFGYEKGAFTGAMPEGKAGLIETGHKGTVFLDEIAELPPDLQVKLLEVIEEKTFVRVGGTRPVTVDVRVIAATNRNLPEMIRKGQFREDLYYRLNVVPISIPPLRRRREDIPPLAIKVIEAFNQAKGTDKRVEPRVIDRLKEYTFPGNVRELINMVERMLIMSDGARISIEDLPEEVVQAPGCALPPINAGGLSLKASLEALEARLICNALESADSMAAAAAALDIHPTTLWRKMTRHGIAGTIAKSQ